MSENANCAIGDLHDIMSGLVKYAEQASKERLDMLSSLYKIKKKLDTLVPGHEFRENVALVSGVNTIGDLRKMVASVVNRLEGDINAELREIEFVLRHV